MLGLVLRSQRVFFFSMILNKLTAVFLGINELKLFDRLTGKSSSIEGFNLVCSANFQLVIECSLEEMECESPFTTMIFLYSVLTGKAI